ncbi:hypothetical protein CAI21_16755 [Alkalilimnicola ehrlichii]|uniref:Oxygen sensor histidine kinase NreB n=1 Tax=Alkalilimnicola ehrlichii TaxID=351052 RepID=A0A3E0WJ40_9GAMM|nr:cache domain-containing protein [Alkalilimnicola ehrlichii]RFA26608.1 hypothetical protein CAI21_16755 [Alkalilimnicola ehrlichii]RFA31885.1 hypothetical protein CAL65_21185 [Alkalilimnicola ehrlichii]
MASAVQAPPRSWFRRLFASRESEGLTGLSFRVKLTLLTLLPLVVMTASLTVIGMDQTTRLSRAQVDILNSALLEARKAELRNYMELGYTAVRQLYENAAADDAIAQERVAELLRNIEYGEDGYFFVYGYDGVNIVHPRLPELEGQQLYEFRDEDGNLLIQALIERAREGGGFTEYRWDKPSGGDSVAKLGYSIGLDRWGWMVGTGVYLDDLEYAVSSMEQRVVDNARHTILSLGAITMLALVLIAVTGLAVNISEGRLANRRLVLMAQKTVSFQEKERCRISRELHDGINQLLVSARYKLERLEAAVEQDDNRAASAQLAAVDRILETGIADLRRMARDLRPSVLDDLGLKAGINTLTADLAERRGLQVSFDCRLADRRWPSTLETALYRIVQEALANIEKHCVDVSQVAVRLRQSLGAVHLEIEDDGGGFDVEAAMRGPSGNSGLGLRNMRDRAELLGGRMRISSRIGRGTAIHVHLPIDAKEVTA